MSDEAVAEKNVIKLYRGPLLKLLKAMGWGTADKKDNKKLAEKIVPSIPDVTLTEPLTDEGDAKLRTDILAGIEAGNTFEVVDDEAAAKPAKAEKKAKLPGDDEEEDSEKGSEEGEKAEKPTKEPKAVKAPKAEKPAKEAKPKAEKPAKQAKAPKAEKPAVDRGTNGMRTIKNRIYLAAQAWGSKGLDHPLTDEFVKEVDDLTGDSNLRQTRDWLKLAWHAVNGLKDMGNVVFGDK